MNGLQSKLVMAVVTKRWQQLQIRKNEAQNESGMIIAACYCKR